MKNYYSLVFCFFSTFTFGQIYDDFTDNDLLLNPTWNGSTSAFITNTSGQLQSNTGLAGASNISLLSNLTFVGIEEWHANIKMTFSPSGSNYARYYLTALSSDLSTNPDGYYIQLGEAGTTDAIRLMKRNGGITSEICAGPVGAISTGLDLSIKILHDPTGSWEIWTDIAGGENYSLIATGLDLQNILGPFTGWEFVYTASNANKFYIDNWYVGPKIVDLIPPSLVHINMINSQQIRLFFDQEVAQFPVEQISNYTFNPSLTLSNVQRDPVLWKEVLLTFNENFINGTQYSFSLINCADTLGNIASTIVDSFHYLISENILPNDVIISEIFADPSPSIGLKNVEYIEIYNRSQKYFNTKKWVVTDGSSIGQIPEIWIAPNQYYILTSTSGIDSFAITPIGIPSFPSLNNTSDSIQLLDSLSTIIDYVNYTVDWYQDELKKDGGYSLELMRLNHPCSSSQNWKASNHLLGGTPGFENSVYDATLDMNPPSIKSVEIIDPTHLSVYFSENIQNSALLNTQIIFNPNLSIQNLNYNLPMDTTFQITFTQPIDTGLIYQITLVNLSDCWLNTTQDSKTFMLPFEAKKGELIINEILFNPLTGGNDWVELYNNSQHSIKLKNLYFANWKDSIANKTWITTDRLIKPNEYLVFGLDSNFTKSHYPEAREGAFINMILPALNNDSSTLFLGMQNTILDKVSYSEKWHFPLLEEVDGVSLERIHPNALSNQESNWHSAAENIKFGTPGRINSQNNEGESNGEVSFTSSIISPNNDGDNDVLQVNYNFETGELLGNFVIYDDQGREVKKLFSNELLAKKGNFTWNGLTSQNVKAEIGIYITIFEAININDGTIFKDKRTFVITGN